MGFAGIENAAESRNHRLLECHRLRWFFSPLKGLQQLLSVAAGGRIQADRHPPNVRRGHPPFNCAAAEHGAPVAGPTGADHAASMTASTLRELTLPTLRSHMAPEIRREKADIAGRVVAL